MVFGLPRLLIVVTNMRSEARIVDHEEKRKQPQGAKQICDSVAVALLTDNALRQFVPLKE